MKIAFTPETPARVSIPVGEWYVAHFQRRSRESGVQTAAKQLRKQGVPVEIAVLILASSRDPATPAIEQAALSVLMDDGGAYAHWFATEDAMWQGVQHVAH